MRRSLALLTLEARVQRRYGIHATGVILAVLWSGVLLLVPPEAALVVTPLVLLVDTATVGVFLGAAMVLLERGEGSLAAVLITPVRTGELIGAKALSLTALSLAIAVPVAVAGARGSFGAASVLAGVGLTALLMLLLGLALVAPHRSIIGFLTFAPWPLIPLMGVPLARGVGLLEHPVAHVVPTTAAFELVAAGFGPTRPQPLAVVYLLACVALAWRFAVRRFDGLVRREGG